ncbi:pali-domain-containing protein, partial [Cryphonectria parasitica EP155]
MIRASTPVAVLLTIAFGLLLVATLSTPVIKSIVLGSVDDVTFGVLGYCTKTGCTLDIEYDAASITTTSDFSISQSIRSAVSKLLIVHPVAALATLIYAVLAVVSHLHSPSHSSRYLLLMFIYGLVSFLVCLLAFLTDIILFNPNVAAGTWIVLAATVLTLIAAIFSFAMMKSLAGRKARQRNIQQNAEMSGENYYNRQRTLAGPSETQPTVPSISNTQTATMGAGLATSFDKETSEDSIPLTQRSPTERSPNVGPVELRSSEAAYSGPVGPRRQPLRDPYGNPINGPPGM